MQSFLVSARQYLLALVQDSETAFLKSINFSQIENVACITAKKNLKPNHENHVQFL
jgi:hypothetical protein